MTVLFKNQFVDAKPDGTLTLLDANNQQQLKRTLS